MRPSLAMALAFAFAALVGGVGFLGARLVFEPAALVTADSAWSEAAWPFLRDAWPAGRAFRCDAAHCGEEVMVYARVKAGMCDCVAGIADDQDLERVSDAGLMAPRISAMGPGEERSLAGLKARMRIYRTEGGSALAVLAGGRNCNAFVAMATARHDLTPSSIDAVRRLLDTPALVRWIARQGG
jgi:hypothetical protein